MLALCSVILMTYYAQNYAGIKFSCLTSLQHPLTTPIHSNPTHRFPPTSHTHLLLTKPTSHTHRFHLYFGHPYFELCVWLAIFIPLSQNDHWWKRAAMLCIRSSFYSIHVYQRWWSELGRGGKHPPSLDPPLGPGILKVPQLSNIKVLVPPII